MEEFEITPVENSSDEEFPEDIEVTPVPAENPELELLRAKILLQEKENEELALKTKVAEINAKYLEEFNKKYEAQDRRMAAVRKRLGLE